MSLLPKVEIDKPRRSNVDLSRINRFSCAPGMNYPVMVIDTYPGDDFKIDLSSLVKTLPLIGPLMGSFKVQFDTFHIPNRLYCRSLHDDITGFDPANVSFPVMELSQYGSDLQPGQSRGVHPSSLWHFLGVPEFFGRREDGTSGLIYRRFNAIPYLGYYEIFRSYYANTQEEYFYTMEYVGGVPAEFGLQGYELSQIDRMRTILLAHDDSTSYVIPNYPPAPYKAEACHDPLGGLVCRTYMPDRFNSWIDSESYGATLSQAVVDVSSGSFDMDALRFASKLNQMLQKTLVSGGRYSDWQKVQYGASMRPHVETPTFVGSVSHELTFEDVIQTSQTTDDNPLGSLGGRGVGYTGNRKTRFYVPEHGFLMTIMSITPRVDYYQGVKHYLRNTRMSQLHVPTLDAIGFQDLTTDDFAAFDTLFTSSSAYTLNAIGKQPAWTELMTATNEIHGDFAEETKLMYMTLARRYEMDADDRHVTNASTYIDPTIYNQNFADASPEAQNFWVQLRIEMYAKRVISKKVMPNL